MYKKIARAGNVQSMEQALRNIHIINIIVIFEYFPVNFISSKIDFKRIYQVRWYFEEEEKNE